MDFRHGLCVSLACALIFSASAAADDGQHYVMATGAPGTKPHVIGVALQSLVNIKLLPKAYVGLNTLSGDDDTENLLAMRDGRSQLGIADSVATDAAARGTGPFQTVGPDRNLKGVAVLWQVVDHFLIASDRTLSGTVTDLVALTSKTIATDTVNRDATLALLTAFGMQVSESQGLPVVEGPGQLDALSNGTVAALAMSDPLPSTDMARIVDTLGGRAQLLEVTGRQLARLGQGWHRHPIPSSTYAFLDHDIDTIARSVMLLADASVDEEIIYQITRTMFENLPFLAAIDEMAALITLDDTLDGMNVSVHPGAARYYQEVGLLPPGSTDPADALSLQASEPSRMATTPLEIPSSSEQRPTPTASTAPRQSPEAPTAEVLPSFALDDAMLNRSRAEIHDGAEILKIDRPEDLDRPGTEVTNVYFGLGKTQPNADGVAETRAVAQRILQLYQSSTKIPEIYVVGHADRTGDWKVNYEIAHRRAVATKDLLASEGVPDDWILISDHSEQKLAVPTADGVGNWRNRRVEVTIIPKQGAAQSRDAAQR